MEYFGVSNEGFFINVSENFDFSLIVTFLSSKLAFESFLELLSQRNTFQETL